MKDLPASVDRLTAAERIAVLGDASASISSNQWPAGDALQLAARLAGDPEREVFERARAVMMSVRGILSPAAQPRFARYVQSALGETARKVGWAPKPTDSEDERLRRAALLPFATRLGNDEALAAEARRLAQSWLENRDSVPPDIAGEVLSTAAHFGDRRLFDRVQSELRSSRNRQDRAKLLAALAAFRDPSLVRASLTALFNGEYDLREATDLLFGPLQANGAERIRFEFLKEHYEKLLPKLPSGTSFELGAYLPYMARSFCDAASRQEVAAFFEPRIQRFDGGARILAQNLERIELCTALADRQRASAEKYLQRF